MNLVNEKILHIIDTTPLVSIDLIIKNSEQQVLLGKRVNRPAKDFWFVPGGRIRKNERLADAVKRISVHELGFVLEKNAGKMLGAYDHIYPDNFLDHPKINTHYVALGYEFQLSSPPKIELDHQHEEVKWFAIEALLQSENVHDNTKAYFLP
ncbi:MAG: GDP-mannose mannosyl hydrolase [Thiotrichaceae bacterium]|nr:GDP-mannose mannosyl hydrolase [Thiotrichaceae bacterium]